MNPILFYFILRRLSFCNFLNGLSPQSALPKVGYDIHPRLSGWEGDCPV